jgi:hypothetical protein
MYLKCVVKEELAGLHEVELDGVYLVESLSLKTNTVRLVGLKKAYPMRWFVLVDPVSASISTSNKKGGGKK